MQIAQMWRTKCRRWNTGALELIWTLKAAMLGLFFILFAAKTATALNSDGKALLSFKQYLNDSNSVLPNWSASDSHPCDWIGVQCDRSKRVTSLNLPFRHLVGTISPDIGKLAKLKRLGLHHNNFYGSIPPEIGNCTNLRALYLCSNYLAGTIPMALGKLTRLRVLDMASNSLTGSIPLTLGNLSNLRFLNLSKNSLIGEIPATGVLANFTNSSFDANLGLCGFQINSSCEILSSAPSPYVPGKQRAHKYTNGLWMSALGTVGISLFLVLMCFWGFFLYNKFGSKQRLAQINSTASTRLVLFHGDLPYTADDLIKKLNALNETDIIGSGGFGTVYRLVMDDGNMFAVKRIGKGGACTEQPFERELEILGSIKHRNLVNLRGYCNSPIARLLIYDFLSHGSLDQYLHDRREPSLNWSSRLRIAVGAARGLSYLHHDCSPRIVHRDIKSSNILLDDNLEPHVSDFGLAKVLEDNDSHVTTIVAGTFGYLAPEYMQSGRVTEKGDVYSYGVVLLELLSGWRPTDPSFVAKGLNIVGWVNTLMKENKQKEIFDPKCEGGTIESMEALLQVAALCITPAPEDRPSMEDVVKMLDGEIMSPCQSDYYDSSSD